MTVAEAVKDSKSGGLFNRALIEYGQSQLREVRSGVCRHSICDTPSRGP